MRRAARRLVQVSATGALKKAIERGRALERVLTNGARRRWRVDAGGTFGDPRRAREIEQTLLLLPGIEHAGVNPRTGRALLVLDAPVGRLPDEICRLLDSGPPPPSVTRVARSVLQRVREMDLRRGRGDGQGRRTKQPDYHALSTVDVTRQLRVSPARGLREGEVQLRLDEHGPNQLGGVEVRSRLQILGDQIFTVPTALLSGAVALSLALGDMIEAGAILLVLGSNVVIGYVTESRAEELLNAWRELPVEWCKVIRDGHEKRIRAADLVVGDILVLRGGDPVPADARVLSSDGMTVDESMLTGESEPVDKSDRPVSPDAALADRRSMIYTGTVVSSGCGRAVVVATGALTELGALERGLSASDRRRGPLEQQLDRLGKTVALGCVAASSLVVVAGALRGRSPAALAREAVALAVAAIPEGFPAAGTTALALASRRLRREGIVIRRLSAAETMGAVSVICADKTGTLTENRMRVERLHLPGVGAVDVSWRDDAGAPRADIARRDGRGAIPEDDLRDLARIAALNADVDVDARGIVRRGSGTERALVELAVALGYSVPERRREARRIREQRRSPDRAFMVTVHEHPELGEIELIKGAPEQVIDMVDTDEANRRELLEANEEMASAGLRVLALAWRRDGRAPPGEPLTMAGLVGLRDPPREGVRQTLDQLQRAGVQTHMLTGDQERTAQAIGRALGIPPSAIHGRITPEQKLDIVHDLEGQGRIVAMAGDGMNDGPALHAADIGVAMGARGSDVARAVADVVLADDELPALVRAVVEGRRLYDNVRRAIGYLLATNASELGLVLTGSVAGIYVLGPLQLLWLNVLTDVWPALALAVEPADEGVLDRPPRAPADPLLSREDVRFVARDAAVLATSAAVSYAVGENDGRDRTRAFTTLAVGQLLEALAWRSRSPEPNPYLGRVIAGGVAMQIVALQSRTLRTVLETRCLTGPDLALAMALGALPQTRRAYEAIQRRLEADVVRVSRDGTRQEGVAAVLSQEGGSR